MLEVLLVFMIDGGEPEISDRVFESFESCAEFVDTLAGESVVNSDHGFEFLSSDGIYFSGQCIEKSDYIQKESI